MPTAVCFSVYNFYFFIMTLRFLRITVVAVFTVFLSTVFLHCRLADMLLLQEPTLTLILAVLFCRTLYLRLGFQCSLSLYHSPVVKQQKKIKLCAAYQQNYINYLITEAGFSPTCLHDIAVYGFKTVREPKPSSSLVFIYMMTDIKTLSGIIDFRAA